MNTHPNSTLKVLQLLLHCGMVCREELNVVLEMMPAAAARRTGAGEERSGAATQLPEAASPQSSLIDKLPAGI